MTATECKVCGDQVCECFLCGHCGQAIPSCDCLDRGSARELPATYLLSGVTVRIREDPGYSYLDADLRRDLFPSGRWLIVSVDLDDGASTRAYLRAAPVVGAWRDRIERAQGRSPLGAWPAPGPAERTVRARWADGQTAGRRWLAKWARAEVRGLVTHYVEGTQEGSPPAARESAACSGRTARAILCDLRPRTGAETWLRVIRAARGRGRPVTDDGIVTVDMARRAIDRWKANPSEGG